MLSCKNEDSIYECIRNYSTTESMKDFATVYRFLASIYCDLAAMSPISIGYLSNTIRLGVYIFFLCKFMKWL